jgi:hypothetical protein
VVDVRFAITPEHHVRAGDSEHLGLVIYPAESLLLDPSFDFLIAVSLFGSSAESVGKNAAAAPQINASLMKLEHPAS